MEKVMGDNEYMKSLMDTLERKVKAEMTKRLSTEHEQKAWLDMQFQAFKDEIVYSDLLRNQTKEICWRLKTTS
jgi:pimeloyl-CoA synthetase